MKERSHSPQDEQSNYQQELIAYKKQIANILESFTDAFCEVTSDWTVIYWNKEAERLLSMPREDIIGKNLWDVYQDAIPLKFHTEYHRAVRENVSVRFEEYFSPKDVWLEVAAFPSGNGLSVYFKDITERKRATDLLTKETKKYNDLFNLNPLPQWVYASDSLRFLDVNEAAIAQYGYSREEFLAMTIADIRPPADVPVLNQILLAQVRPGLAGIYDVRHAKKNGQIIDVIVASNSISFDGREARMVVVFDRTKEIQSIKDMETSMARLDIVSKATSDAIWDLDMTTGEMIWNQGIRGIFGYPKTVYDWDWWKSKVHPEDYAELKQKLEDLIASKETRLSTEYRFQCEDGEYRFVLDRSFVLFDDAGKAVRMIGSMQDITNLVEQVKATEAQHAKLRDIAWIQAHSVRGPLSNIMGLAELLDGNQSKGEINALVTRLKASAEQLDGVLMEILNKA